jgi:uncharacterized PurR-regulated membrane protein YhhQ (DUF165 family)
MILASEAARLLPAAPFWEHQEAYNNILGHFPQIVIASIAAYFVGEFCNSYVLAKIKVRMNGKAMPLRFRARLLPGR